MTLFFRKPRRFDWIVTVRTLSRTWVITIPHCSRERALDIVTQEIRDNIGRICEGDSCELYSAQEEDGRIIVVYRWKNWQWVEIGSKQ